MRAICVLSIFLSLLFCAACTDGYAEVSRHGYVTQYQIPPRGSSPKPLDGTLYYRGNPLALNIGYASVKRDGSRAVFVQDQKIFYTKGGVITRVDVANFSVPTDVIWKKYQAEILFADQEPHVIELF